MDFDGVDENHVALELLIRGFQVSRMIRAVADLGVADQIPIDASRNIDSLAKACSVLAPPLLRVLRALSAFGIFRVAPDGSVAHSARSMLLRKDAPDSLYYSARFWTTASSWNAWGALDTAFSGEVPHETVWHTKRFEYLREHPDEARRFDDFMAHYPDNRHAAVAAAYDFSGASTIVDVGGGNGETLRHILSRFSRPRGLVLDREDVVAAIGPDMCQDGRITTEGGNYFEHVPAGADLYLLIRVLHDWEDEDCVQILRTCRAAMLPNARLLIVEQILERDPSRGEPVGYLVDTHMMVMFGHGRERTVAEVDELLAASGFVPVRLIHTESPVSIIEVAPQ
jgi:hypothetical protein